MKPLHSALFSSRFSYGSIVFFKAFGMFYASLNSVVTSFPRLRLHLRQNKTNLNSDNGHCLELVTTSLQLRNSIAIAKLGIS